MNSFPFRTPRWSADGFPPRVGDLCRETACWLAKPQFYLSMAQTSTARSVESKCMITHQQSLLLHSAILKPDFNLLVAQVQFVRELFSFLSVYKFIQQEFALKFSQLRLSIGLPLFPLSHL